MFPDFRIISNGSLGGTDTFISNESFYAPAWGGTESPTPSLPDATESGLHAGQELAFPEGDAPEQVADENSADES